MRDFSRCRATASSSQSGATDSAGTDSLAGLTGGAVYVTPAKMGDVNGISFFDASLASGFLTFFSGDAATAPTELSVPGAVRLQPAYYVGLSPTAGTFKMLTQSTTDLIVEVSGFFAP